jgi:toxin ParE1/3/4
VVKFTKEALDDLECIRAHIALEYPERAARIAAGIMEKCKLLDSNPHVGRHGREPGTRELSTARPWVVVYEVGNSGPVVLRVWHSSQSRE